MRDVITLSKKELDRVTVLQQCLQGHLTRVQAAKRLELSYRHTKRLTNALRHGGREALVSKRRGKPGNNRIHQDVRQRGVQLIRDRYSDFGPTLAREKLAELHHIKISRETLRKWMMDEGRWKGRKRKAPKLFHLRARRPQFGDLVQIDGSPHDWLEDRAPRCTLINFVDDATGKILYARF